MTRYRRIDLLLAGVSWLCLGAAGAHAQSVDYGSFEQMFSEPVTTSATGSPQRATEAPADMTIVTQDDIRRSGADNIPDILSMVTGMQIVRSSFNQVDVAIRGYDFTTNPRMLVLIDGRSVFDGFFGFVPWGSLPIALSEIRQIEVVRGPSSALFGFNAAAGVINIVTYDPLYDKVDNASIATGTQALAEGSAIATVRRDDVGGTRIVASGLRANEFAAIGDQAPTPDHPLNAEIHLASHYRIGSSSEISASGGFSNSTYYGADIPPNLDSLRANFVQSDLASATSIGRLELKAYRNQTRTLNGTSGDENNVVYDAQASDLIKLGAAHTLRASLEFLDNQATSQPLFRGTAGYRDYVAALMWNWQLRDTISLTNAARLDHVGLDYTGVGVAQAGITSSQVGAISHNAVSFNSAIVWAVTPSNTIRLIVARGLQLPTLVGLAVNLQFGPTVAIAGNPRLTPTAVTSAELSYDRAISSIGSVAHIAAYAERNDDLSSNGGTTPPVVSQGVLLFQGTDTGHSDALGIEIGLKGAAAAGILTGARWNASYALEAISDHLLAGLAYYYGEQYAPATPRHTLIAGLGYSRGKWELDIEGRWQSRYEAASSYGGPGAAPFPIRDFLTLTSRAGYQVTRTATVSLSGQQLLRSRIQEAFGVGVERRVIALITLHI